MRTRHTFHILYVKCEGEHYTHTHAHKQHADILYLYNAQQQQHATTPGRTTGSSGGHRGPLGPDVGVLDGEFMQDNSYEQERERASSQFYVCIHISEPNAQKLSEREPRIGPCRVAVAVAVAAARKVKASERMIIMFDFGRRAATGAQRVLVASTSASSASLSSSLNARSSET